MKTEISNNARDPQSLEDPMQHLLMVALDRDDLLEIDTPLGKLTREFFANNWINCRDGLLQRTARICVWPEPGPAPRLFRFQIASPYKRKFDSNSIVERMPGPIRGHILYRGDMFENPRPPTLAVLLDRDQGFFHPNVSREQGCVCLGNEQNLPCGPLPLDLLLENHVYPILTYQNRHPADPADLEAARYFALDPAAMAGLEPVEPLY